MNPTRIGRVRQGDTGNTQGIWGHLGCVLSAGERDGAAGGDQPGSRGGGDQPGERGPQGRKRKTGEGDDETPAYDAECPHCERTCRILFVDLDDLVGFPLCEGAFGPASQEGNDAWNTHCAECPSESY